MGQHFTPLRIVIAALALSASANFSASAQPVTDTNDSPGTAENSMTACEKRLSDELPLQERIRKCSVNASKSNAAGGQAASRSPDHGDLSDAEIGQADAEAPPYLFRPHVGVAETVTDNVLQTETDRMTDLISRISAGSTLTADTPRLQGLFDYTGTLQRNLNATDQDHFSNNLFGTAQATVVPSFLFVDLHATAGELSRQANAVPNSALLTSSDLTQTYAATVSPDVKTRVGDIGFGDLRYTASGAWFTGNTGAIGSPNGGIGPLTNSFQQHGSADLKMPGTLVNRLYTDAFVNALYSDSGGQTGIFRRSVGEAANEYQITPSFSFIGVGGYEVLKGQSAQLTGSGAVWDVGGRWRPNADSSVLLLYGRHDLHNDFSGEMRFKFTDFTGIYAAYTDSLTNSEQSIISNNANAVLDPEGPVGSVNADQDATIASLNNPQNGPSPQNVDIAAGLPLEDLDNILPQENDIARVKMLRGVADLKIYDNAFEFEGFHAVRDSLTGQLPLKLVTDGGTLSWHREIRDQLTANAGIGYHASDLNAARQFNATLGLQYGFSPTAYASIRYDFIHRTANPPLGGAIVNALTIAINKSFN